MQSTTLLSYAISWSSIIVVKDDAGESNPATAGEKGELLLLLEEYMMFSFVYVSSEISIRVSFSKVRTEGGTSGESLPI